ncbi:hypothetical protein [Aminobacter sp. AP02]|uniref:hypothetical protein n=1 Tax=Aminobacter sp. AP02 TaxID=2135737 RepID=UPI000D7AF118|nr:hypothetical protein [Aminobacter sp. AP02]PWK76878.1 hypothetical protein C8K44_101204 [Aminobacter sp. AP02]
MTSGSEFEGQFVIADGRLPERAGSKRILLTSLCVDVFERLETVEVVQRDGSRIGILLGTPIDPDERKVVVDRYVVDADIGETTSFDELDEIIEKHIYRLVGSFAFVLDVPQARRLYLDANGTKSAVYSATDHVAAATAALVLPTADIYFERLDRSLHAALRVDKDGWFPAGLTAHDGVKRLICNHYLDFDTWTCVRHWPRAPMMRDEDPEKAIDTIVDQARRAIVALSKAGETNLALTAGHDTRLLLACSKELRSDVGFVTVGAPGAELDVKRARELSLRFGLRHQTLPYVEANSAQMQVWQKKVSHGITGSNLRLHPSVRPLEDTIFVGGVGGEVGRGFLWLGSDDHTKLDADGIITRLKLPLHPRLRLAVDAWLRPLRDLEGLLILDLAFMELRVSSWAFAQAYALPRYTEVNPLISRKSYQAMLSLPPSVRRNNGMIHSCVRSAWPETLDLPINKYGDWRDKYEKARDAVFDPRRALRKLHQLAWVRTRNALSRNKSTKPAI